MAMTVSLVLGGDFISDVSEYSLLSGTNAFHMEEWLQATDQSGDEPVTEVINLWANDTNQAAIAVHQVALEGYFHRAEESKRSASKYVVWLRAQLAAENWARQSPVYGGGFGDSLDLYGIEATRPVFPRMKLLVERAPWWEHTVVATATLTGQNACGGVSATGTAYGSLPARIGYLSLIGASGVALVEFWGGFLSDHDRTLANFVSPWDLGSGTAGTDTAAGGDGMVCTFTTTPTRATRVTLTPYQISASNFADQRGTFNVLLRAKCGSGVTARVYVGSGLGSSIAYNGPITVTGTTSKIYPAGQVTIPGGGRGSSFYDAIRNTALTIQAELVSGSAGAGALDMDCLIPIPADYSFHVGGGSGNNTLALLTHPLGIVSGYTYSGANINGLADVTGTEARTFQVPYGNYRVVLAGQRSTGSTVSDTANIVIREFYRYRTVSDMAI